MDDCSGFIGGIYRSVTCGHKLIGISGLYVALKDILVFDMYMAIMWLAKGAINHTISFVMLK